MANEQLILNRYRPIAEAGSGGFGTVQFAWDTDVYKRQTLKVPSGWLEVTGKDNDDLAGTRRYVDTDEDENNVVVVTYDLRPESGEETAEQDIMAKRVWAEEMCIRDSSLSA